MARPPHRPSEGGGGGGGESRDRDGTPAQYWVSFPTILDGLRCPVEGCQGTAASRTNLRVHFAHKHPRDSIVIMGEGKQSHPWCPQCGMFVPQEALNWAHPTSAMCRIGKERKSLRLVAEDTDEQMGRIFLAYGTPLTAVSSFRYRDGTPAQYWCPSRPSLTD